MDDDTGCWGECIRCGKRFGFVEREALRKYIDEEVEIELARIKKELFPEDRK